MNKMQNCDFYDWCAVRLFMLSFPSFITLYSVALKTAFLRRSKMSVKSEIKSTNILRRNKQKQIIHCNNTLAPQAKKKEFQPF